MNRITGCISLRRSAVAAVTPLLGLTLLTACGTYVPEGATVISVKDSPSEFDRGEIQPSENELADQRVIKMKWYDTNTFITTATLTPGLYSFRARNFDGAGFQQDVRIEPDKGLYELDGARKQVADNEAEDREGPQVSGTIQGLAQGGRAASVSVLFIGNEIVMRTANLKRDGSFSVKAPYEGTWRIEVHMLGKVPRSYVHAVTDVRAPVNLGGIVLK